MSHKKLIVEITSPQQFRSEVMESDVPVLVDFFATWCGPCKQMKPLLHELSLETEGQLKIVTVNVEEQGNTELVERLGIESLPTFILLKNGKQIKISKGSMDKMSLISFVNHAF